MAVIFKTENHKYQSLDPDERINWISITSFVAMFKEKFDPIAQSIKSSKNKRSKWYGMEPAAIQAHWNSETERALGNGNFYHDQRESDIISIGTLQRKGIDVPIVKPIYIEGVKHAPIQKLNDGIYPEHLVYLKSAGICGQSDRVEVVNGIVDIIDYKTNKEIRKEGFVNWEGISKKMTGPCAHLDDCNFNHYSLQLSAYMFMIIKHNPRYKPGKMMLHHVVFEKEGEDEFGNPIYIKNEKDEPIVKTVIPYEVPYLKSEIIAMINWLDDQRKLNNYGK